MAYIFFAVFFGDVAHIGDEAVARVAAAVFVDEVEGAEFEHPRCYNWVRHFFLRFFRCHTTSSRYACAVIGMRWYSLINASSLPRRCDIQGDWAVVTIGVGIFSVVF